MNMDKDNKEIKNLLLSLRRELQVLQLKIEAMSSVQGNEKLLWGVWRPDEYIFLSDKRLYEKRIFLNIKSARNYANRKKDPCPFVFINNKYRIRAKNLYNWIENQK